MPFSSAACAQGLPMRRYSILAVFLFLGGLAAHTQSVDWPMYHMNPQHTGFNRAETSISRQNVIFLRKKWEGILRGIVDFSSPAIVGNFVYLGSTDGNLYVFNSNGCGGAQFCTAVWKGHTGGEIFSSPAVVNGVVYIGSNNHHIFAFDAAGCGSKICQPLWAGDLGGSVLQSSPVVSGGLVFVGGYDGELYAFNAAGCGASHCSPIWTGATGDHITSSPAIWKKIVYVGSNDSKLYAFQASGCGVP